MQPGFRYADWAERARQFAISQGRLKACYRWRAASTRIDGDTLDGDASRLMASLPAPLRAFLLEAGELSFEYIHRVAPGSLQQLFPRRACIVGGADITLAGIAASHGMFDSLVDDSVVHDNIGPLGVHLLRNSCPFIAWADGDQLVLDASQADIAVYYWSHDGASFPVSSSFTSFLTYWETINYLSPDFWGAFTVQRPGSLLGSSDESSALRTAWETLT